MRSCLVLCVAAALVGGVLAHCDACIDGKCYKQQLLPVATGFHADIDRNTNTLYITDRELIKQCNLDKGTCKSSANQWDIERVAVDQRTGEIYGSVFKNGIYKLDLVNNKRVLFDPTENAWFMRFQDKLYYSGLSDYGTIFTSEGGISRRVAGTEGYNVLDFIVDKRDDIYFFHRKDETYATKRLSRGVVSRTNLPDDYFRGAVDKDGNAMFIEEPTNTVYRVINDQSVEVGVVNETYYMYDFIFGRDNDLIYYTVNYEWYHLKRDSVLCTTSTVGNTKIITETVVSSTVPPIESTTSRASDGENSSDGPL